MDLLSAKLSNESGGKLDGYLALRRAIVLTENAGEAIDVLGSKDQVRQTRVSGPLLLAL